MPSNQRGTGYQNLQQWLSLNQGSASRMGNALAEGAEEKGRGFNEGLSAATSSFNTKLNDAQDMGVIPDNVTSAQAAEFGARQWAGPDGLDAGAVADLYGKAAAAQNAANATGSNVGRQTLLQQRYGGQNTWGGGALDAALAGTGGGAARMAASRGAYGRLVSNLGGAQQSARDAAASGRKQFEDATADWRSRVPGLQQKERLEAGAKGAQQRANVQVGAYTPQDEEERNRYP